MYGCAHRPHREHVPTYDHDAADIRCRYWLEKRRLGSCQRMEQQRCELVEILTPVIPGMVPSGLVIGRRDAVTSEQMTRVSGILMRQPIIPTDRDPQKACLVGDRRSGEQVTMMLFQVGDD